MFQLTVLVLAVLTLGTLATRSDRIVGGQTATRGQFPHAASLRANNGSFHFCGATIISNRFVLSAAHCTQGRFSNVREVQVAVGAHTRYDGTLHTVSRIANHPRFTMDRIQNDVSVVQTARTIVFGPTVRAISLPTSNLAPSTQVVVTDWGQHRPGNPSSNPLHRPGFLQFKTAENIRLDYCRALLPPNRRDWIFNSTVCVQSRGDRSVCVGDSGGGLIYNNAVVGVVSCNIRPCGFGGPDMYARIYSFLPFIRSAMGA